MNQDNKVSVEMTEADYREYQALKAKKARAEAKVRSANERQALRELSEATVDEQIARLKALNHELRTVREGVYEAFKTVIETKSELYQVDSNQRSHTFRNADSSSRITVGFHVRDSWDDTVEEGITKVKDYVSGLAKDDDTKQLVAMLLDLLSRDKQGNLQADKVLQLDKFAAESDNELFRDGVDIIKNAYRPERSKLFIRAEEKNDKGMWVNIPLNITEA